MARQIIIHYKSGDFEKIEIYLRKRNFVICADRSETENPVVFEHLDTENDRFPVKVLVLADEVKSLKGTYAPAYKAFRMPIEEANVLEVNFLPDFSEGKSLMTVRYEQKNKNLSAGSHIKSELFHAAAQRFLRWLRNHFELIKLV